MTGLVLQDDRGFFTQIFALAAYSGRTVEDFRRYEGAPDLREAIRKPTLRSSPETQSFARRLAQFHSTAEKG